MSGAGAAVVVDVNDMFAPLPPSPSSSTERGSEWSASSGSRGRRAAQPGGAKRLGVEPPGRPAERRQVHASEHRHLPKRAEPRAQLGGVQLRLLPGGEVPTL